MDAALARSAQYLVSKQNPDGAWRSETYGALRIRPDLTPYVMSSLFFMPQGGPAAREAFVRGEKLLMEMVTPDGEIRGAPDALSYPVYTAASASRMAALRSRDAAHQRAQQAWLKLILAQRLGRELGWQPEDPDFGGWGFAMSPPRKPQPGEFRPDFCESNLSATLFGIAALRSSRVPNESPLYAEALLFVQRCQNYGEAPERTDPRFDDGGFFFTPTDAAQNKAGVAGADRFGRTRFHSYGSMTADGLRALLRCGLPPAHPRVAAARKWLAWNFDAHRNPGTFTPEREAIRNATYYYYAWGVAHAFQALGVREIQTRDGKVDWAAALTEQLLARQQPNGSWVNRCTDAKEDDPLIATPWAAAALAICRAVLTGQDQRLFAAPAPPREGPR